MPRRVVFTPGMRSRILTLLAVETYPHIARQVGCDVTTLKRYLVREGLIETDTAKYLSAPRQDKWIRPCMRCKDATPRPKGLYLCDCCRKLTEGMG